ncbi:hypothetical protein E2562_001132 [Oryza meyeriana var. granulata]|uniref:Uncharacterized protein n=1 Tax=Oryza meyeriana var. granulata TaxID=110450 RepID=A0A6G1EDJ1_9ORYZ|nr:hypothetical protein E2562_001132 [Oryza meyeriana var. granulata]
MAITPAGAGARGRGCKIVPAGVPAISQAAAPILILSRSRSGRPLPRLPTAATAAAQAPAPPHRRRRPLPRLPTAATAAAQAPAPPHRRRRPLPRLPTAALAPAWFAAPRRYELRLHPNLVACSFTGATSVLVDVSAPTHFLVLNAADLAIDRASIRFQVSITVLACSSSLGRSLTVASWGVSAPGWLQDLVPTGVSLFEEDEILVLKFGGELPLGKVTQHPRVTRRPRVTRGADLLAAAAAASPRPTVNRAACVSRVETSRTRRRRPFTCARARGQRYRPACGGGARQFANFPSDRGVDTYVSSATHTDGRSRSCPAEPLNKSESLRTRVRTRCQPRLGILLARSAAPRQQWYGA